MTVIQVFKAMPNAVPSSAPAARRARRSPTTFVARRALWLGRALRAPRGRQRLWLRALLVVALVRVGLWTASLTALQVLVSRLGRGRYSAPIPAHAARAAAERGVEEPAEEPQVLVAGEERAEREAAWAVRSSARLVVGATCLTQALALQVLLGRGGLGSRLCLGARKNAGGKFEAHAWVERNGQVLIGGEECATWTPLTSWDFAASPGQGRQSQGAAEDA